MCKSAAHRRHIDWGLRSYLDLPDSLWGVTVPDCPHEWGDEQPRPGGEYRDGEGANSTFAGREDKAAVRASFRRDRAAVMPREDKAEIRRAFPTRGDYPMCAKQASNRGSVEAPAGPPGGGSYCRLCGAWRGKWGLEPVLDCGGDRNRRTCGCYVCNTIEVMREVRRVLRDDGCVFWNIGDAYAHSGPCGGSSPDGPRKPRAADAEAQRALNLCAASGLKPKDMCLVPQRVALALQADGWWVRSQIIWHKACLAAGEVLWTRTQKGVMPATVKDLVRLRPETVELWDGAKWNRVVSWSQAQSPPEPLEVELRSGERICCTPEHRWPTPGGLVEAQHLRRRDVILSAQLPDTGALGGAGIPDGSGFVVGLYLAEGCRDGQGGLAFALHAKERHLAAEVRRFAAHFDGRTVESVGGNSLVVKMTGNVAVAVIDRFIASDGAHKKHLSNAAWQRGNGFLRELLNGYLEGDGHRDAKTERWRLGFCSNDFLAQDLRTLGARLGYSVRLKRCMRECTTTGKLHRSWNGSIMMDPQNRKCRDTEVVAIRCVHPRKFYDVALAEPPHLFALASGVLSHNSCMPSSQRDRPTTDYEIIWLLAKAERYFFDLEAGREAHKEPWRSTGKAESSGPKWNADPTLTKAATRDGVRLYDAGGRAPRTTWRLRSEPSNYDFCDSCGTLFIGSDRKAIRARQEGEKVIRICPVCKAEDQWTSHYAAFPISLPLKAIALGSSEKGQCAKCRKPWVRALEHDRVQTPMCKREVGCRERHTKGERWITTTSTLGWRPDCECEDAGEPVAQTVMDFCLGTGQTAIAALQMGRRCIGIEASPRYARLAAERVRVLGERRHVEPPGEAMPLFTKGETHVKP